MAFRNLCLLLVLAFATTFVLTHGCTDLGSELPPPPVISSLDPDSGGVGDEIKIRGRNFGDNRRNSAVRFGSVDATSYDEWDDDEIKVFVPQGAQPGLVRVKTVSGESNGATFRLLSVFGVGQKNVNLAAGDSLVQIIIGGIQPYVFVSKGDTTVAAVLISGTSLTLRGVAVGSSTVIIGESSVPQLRDTITITVSTIAPISFAGQIQPLLTSGCVDRNCHPGNGAPFSLREIDNSYQNLVNAPASIPCLGLTLRVKPSSADSSILYRRISGNSCFSQMPLGFPALDTPSQSLIRNWINQGANP